MAEVVMIPTDEIARILEEIDKPCSREGMAQRAAVCRRGLELLPKELDLEHWAILQAELGDSLAQVPAGDRTASQEGAIEAYRRALTAIDRNERRGLWRRVTVNLANVLSHRLTGPPAGNLEEAITLYEQVLAGVDPKSEPGLCATVMNNCASAYTRRIAGVRADNIEKAIGIYGEVRRLQTRGKDPEAWARCTFNLALAYLERIRGDRADNLELALGLIEEAAEVITRERYRWEWATLTNSLANVYAERIRGPRRENLERAIQADRQVLAVWARESAPLEWATVHNNLGTLYQERIAGERAENLELAIQSFEQALTVRSRASAPFDWAQTVHNLANAFAKRIYGDPAQNLERAIELYEEALSVRTREALPGEWAATLDDLANAYTERIRGDRVENLERAIELLWQILEVRTREAMPQEWAVTSNKLGIAYLFRVRGDRAENLERAIEVLTEVLAVWTPESNPLGYARTSLHLGHAYYRLTQDGERVGLEEAIRSYRSAAEAAPREQEPFIWARAELALGNAFQQRVEGIREDNLAESVRCYRAALTVLEEPFERARALCNLANSHRALSQGRRGPDFSRARDLYHEALQVLSLEAVPANHLKTQSALGRMDFQGEDWDGAHHAFSAALAARNLLYTAGATTEARQHALEDGAEVPAMDAYCLARLGRVEEGVEVLERARARALREALARNEAALEQASPEHRSAFLALRERIASLEAEDRAAEGGEGAGHRRGFLEISGDLGTARQELAGISEQIRAYVPGFMPAEPGFPEVAAAASFAGLPIVYLITVEKGSLALIVPPGKPPESVWMPGFASADLEALLPRYLEGTVLDDQDALTRSLDAAWTLLGPKLLVPLARQLSSQGWTRAALVAVGLLDLLPLAAMAPAEFLFTPVPSARALHTACRSLRQRSGAEPVFLGVGDPSPSSEEPLPSAAQEVEAIAPLFPAAGRRLLLRTQATRQEVLAAIPEATHVHFACHGLFDPVTPLDSALVLGGDDRLTWREILDGKLDLSATRLAVLSACQTGIKDYRRVPDEVVGFPSALLQAGVPGVLSALWPVDDAATSLLLPRFYKLHLESHLDPAEALRSAQQWLSTATAEELGSPDGETFAHPVYWAGFVFSGAFA